MGTEVRTGMGKREGTVIRAKITRIVVDKRENIHSK